MAKLKQNYRGQDGVLYLKGTDVSKIPKKAKINPGKDAEDPIFILPLNEGVTEEDVLLDTDEDGLELDDDDSGDGEEEETELPTGFPSRALLIKNHFDTMEKVDAASDETLMAIDGIATASLQAIRAAIK